MLANLAAEEGASATATVDSTEERFAALVNRHSRFLFRVAYAVVRNAHDAEDVVQETFLKLYRWGRWETIENERAFLARSTWRTALDRRVKVRLEEVDAELPAAGRSPEGAAIAANRHAVIMRLIDTLPEELRQPLALSGLEEMSSQQIAGIMGTSEGTVRSRLMRARQILRQKLAAYE